MIGPDVFKALNDKEWEVVETQIAEQENPSSCERHVHPCGAICLARVDLDC